MAKFKIGDKVRAKKNLRYGVNYPGNIDVVEIRLDPGVLDNVRDRLLTIVGYTCFGNYLLNDGTGQSWSDSMLEPVEFTKDNLKDGMVVEYANGNRRLLCNNHFMGEKLSSRFDSYCDDLTNKYGSDYNVNKVYQTSGTVLQTIFRDENLTLIWERPEETKEEPCKEMTVKEIEAALGYKIKVVGKEEK